MLRRRVGISPSRLWRPHTPHSAWSPRSPFTDGEEDNVGCDWGQRSYWIPAHGLQQTRPRASHSDEHSLNNACFNGISQNLLRCH